MTTTASIMSQLKKLGTAQTRKTFSRHGAPEDMFGVSVADLKTIAKKIKGEQELALELFDTGNCDAQYLAGIVADGQQMNKTTLNRWAKNAAWHMVSEYPVAWVACESKHADSLAEKWVKSKQSKIASSGWCTYSGIVATNEDEDLDLTLLDELMTQVLDSIDEAPNRVKYTMNGFVIAVGSYVKPLLKSAKSTAKKLGKVSVDVGETACKVPIATDYIAKVEKAKRIGNKRKTIKC